MHPALAYAGRIRCAPCTLPKSEPMVFTAGLVLLFLGLALVVAGRIELGPGKVISAVAARWTGGILLLFLPAAIVMHFLWQRPDWGSDIPLVNAQWYTFGTLVAISSVIVGWSLYQSSKAALTERLLKKAMFEEVRDDEPPAAENEVKPEPIMPPAKPSGRRKSKGDETPFDFS